ncbi:hypothetical protein ACFLQI_01860 [Candidatus Undinarchaeota archaeon]
MKKAHLFAVLLIVVSLGCLEDWDIKINIPDFEFEGKKTRCDQVDYEDICISCNSQESGKTVYCTLDFKWNKRYLWEICTPEAAFPGGRAPRFGQACASRTFNETECYLLLEMKLNERISIC